MKMPIALLCLFVLLFSCDLDGTECNVNLCAGPPTIIFEVISNGENVIENGTYDIEDILIEGDDSDRFDLSIGAFQTSGGEITTLELDNSNWSARSYDITLNFGSDFSAQIELVTATPEDECCEGIPFLREISIDGNTISLGSEPFRITLN